MEEIGEIYIFWVVLYLDGCLLDCILLYFIVLWFGEKVIIIIVICYDYFVVEFLEFI